MPEILNFGSLARGACSESDKKRMVSGLVEDCDPRFHASNG